MNILMPDIMKVEYNVRVFQEAKSLAKAGHSVTIIGFSNIQKKRQFKLEKINVISFYLHDARKGLGIVFRLISAIKMILGIYYYILFTKADVYHTHNFHVLPVCFLSARLNKGKLLYDTHESWTIHRSSKYHLEHITAFFVEKIFLRFIDAFITINEMIAEFYQFKYNIQDSVILYNTRHLIPRSKLNLIHDELNLNRSKIVAFFVGGLWPSGRGIIELIQSVQYLDNRVVVVFMGYGSNMMIERMEKKIKEIKAKDRIFILSKTTPDRVMNYVMSADIGMNLIKRESRAQDFQSPWKLFEFCMGGLAVISTDLPFHRKVYENYKIGLLCDRDNNPKSIAESINKIIQSKNKIKFYQEQSRLAAEKEYNWEFQENKLLKLYNELSNISEFK
jgi:glycosyltransferase involved in cell wall biosynthesis